MEQQYDAPNKAVILTAKVIQICAIGHAAYTFAWVIILNNLVISYSRVNYNDWSGSGISTDLWFARLPLTLLTCAILVVMPIIGFMACDGKDKSISKAWLPKLILYTCFLMLSLLNYCSITSLTPAIESQDEKALAVTAADEYQSRFAVACVLVSLRGKNASGSG